LNVTSNSFLRSLSPIKEDSKLERSSLAYQTTSATKERRQENQGSAYRKYSSQYRSEIEDQKMYIRSGLKRTGSKETMTLSPSMPNRFKRTDS
jgi:hypothetical protein